MNNLKELICDTEDELDRFSLRIKNEIQSAVNEILERKQGDISEATKGLTALKDIAAKSAQDLVLQSKYIAVKDVPEKIIYHLSGDSRSIDCYCDIRLEQSSSGETMDFKDVTLERGRKYSVILAIVEKK